MPTSYDERLRELAPARLMELAREQSGLTDFGDMTFVKALEELTSCYALDVNFSPAGLIEGQGELVRLLVNRLRFQDDLKRHPEILEEDVSDPIVIIGLPRSGTTKLHRMMASDPTLLKTRMWELLNPARFPNAVPGQQDPRIAAAFGSDSLLEDNPALHKAQYFGATEVHEDLWLFKTTFNDTTLASGQYPVSSFGRWARTRTKPSDRHNYAYVRQLFQYLQWQQGGSRGGPGGTRRRWLMKNVGHLPHMRELIEMYPKGTFVHIHRHPVFSVASVGDLVKNVWDLRVEGSTLDYSGAYNYDRSKWAIDTYLKLREDPAIDSRIVDIPYEQVRQDPMSVIRDLYARAGMVLTPQAEQEMLAWDGDNEQGKRGKHEYTLAELGFSAEMIERDFKDYIDRYVNPAHAGITPGP